MKPAPGDNAFGQNAKILSEFMAPFDGIFSLHRM